MLRRQDSSLSASRRQAAAAGTTPPPPQIHHAKAIGCMSGFIHLFSKYHNSNKRRLTFGKKQEKRKPLPSPTKSAIEAAKISTEDDKASLPEGNRLTCAAKLLRSPTLSPEIRRSVSPEKSRTPPCSLVARLMGLEDLGASAKRPVLAAEGMITEKRRQLLQALEKCNEDLEALKSIIKAVQTADLRHQPPTKSGGNGGSAANIIPVDELTRSPVNRGCVVQDSMTGGMCVRQHRKPTTAKKPGEGDEAIARLVTNATMMESSSLEMRRRVTAAAAAASPPWSSRVMIESVEEVCNEIAWGEKREIGRIGVVLQDQVCRDLIEELIKDLESCNLFQPLPREACKRKLSF